MRLRQLYRCTPTQLEAEPLDPVLDDVLCLNTEAEVAKLRSGR